MGSNSEIQGYNLYPMLHFCRKFSSSITTYLLKKLLKRYLGPFEVTDRPGSYFY